MWAADITKLPSSWSSLKNDSPRMTTLMNKPGNVLQGAHWSSKCSWCLVDYVRTHWQWSASTLSMYFSASDIEGRFLKVGVLPSGQHSLRFSEWRTPQLKLLYTKIGKISLGLNICPPEHTIYNALRGTMPLFTPKLQKQSLQTFT